MSVQSRSFDVVVVGAGPAGAAAALSLAKDGRSVVVVDRRPIGTTGSRCALGVPPEAFVRAGIPRPVAPELLSQDFPFWMTGPEGRGRFRVPVCPLLVVDAGRMTDRILALAREAGAEVIGDVAVREARFEGERLASLAVAIGGEGRSRQRSVTLSARLFIDATGIAGALRRLVPRLARDCPDVPASHVCAAAEQFCEVADPDGALAWARQSGVARGEGLVTLGVNGPYSVRDIVVSRDLGHVEVLGGSVADGVRPTGAGMVEAFCAANAWVGRATLADAGHIPVRRSYDRLVAPGVALVGTAACQVMPAHASGVGLAFLAARMLADAVGGADDPGDEAVLWRYASRYQRSHGAVMGAYDVMRRLSIARPPSFQDDFIGAGLMTAEDAEAGLRLELPPANAIYLAGKVRAALAHPALVAGVAPWALRIAVTSALYRAYPSTPDPVALRRWSLLVAAAVGDEPDVPL